MDNKKEIEKTSEIIKMFDLETSRINPFGDNKVAERAYRRAERISAAIYLLTAHLADAEPLKIRARDFALKLVGNVLNIKDEVRSNNSERLISFRSTSREAVSLIRLLAIVGHVSMSNAEAVCGALEELHSFITSSQRSSLAESISFTKDELLDVRSYVTRDDVEREVRRAPEPRAAAPEASFSRPQSASRPVENQPQVASDGLSLRARSIVEVLRSSGEMGIRDVVSHLPEYSEKMIQRELAELVDAGTVKKVGLKRWSRYSVVV